MIKIRNKYLALLGVFLILTLFYASSIEKENFIDQEETEKYLKNASIVSIQKNLEMGRTNFWRVVLDKEEKELKAIFKHVNRPRPGLLPDCYKYEIAAYSLNKMLGLNIVPPVVEREINNQTGSLQILIENVMTERDREIRGIKPENPQEFKNRLDVIHVFEKLVHDQYKDTHDILIQLDNWKIWRVDFSEAFLPSSATLNQSPVDRCSEDLYKNLLNIKNKRLEKELNPYLNKKEINALIERKDIIVKTIQNLIKKKGEKSVLF